MTMGRRILVWGNSCSGKSTLASLLSKYLDIPLIDLDALNWLPNWEGLNVSDPSRLEARMQQATSGEEWVVAGSYTAQSKKIIWPRVDTVIWLDLPRPVLVWRCLRRSWLRSRQQTLLWGTNQENFFDQLKVWRGEESLLWWVFTQHQRKRTQTLNYIADGTWQGVEVIRCRRTGDLETLLTRNDLPLIEPSYADGEPRWQD